MYLLVQFSRVICRTASADESELKEHVLPLVYELHKVHPLMLVYIFPELAQQLKAEDIEVRAGVLTPSFEPSCAFP